MKYSALAIFTFVFFYLASCVTSNTQKTLFDSNTNLENVRIMQTRKFETNDKEKILKDIMSTFQDLGFIVDKADITLCMVSATKLDSYESIRMTVTVKLNEGKHILVRANGQYGRNAVTDPLQYKEFFNSLEKAVLLPALPVE